MKCYKCEREKKECVCEKPKQKPICGGVISRPIESKMNFADNLIKRYIGY